MSGLERFVNLCLSPRFPRLPGKQLHIKWMQPSFLNCPSSPAEIKDIVLLVGSVLILSLIYIAELFVFGFFFVTVLGRHLSLDLGILASHTMQNA